MFEYLPTNCICFAGNVETMYLIAVQLECNDFGEIATLSKNVIETNSGSLNKKQE